MLNGVSLSSTLLKENGVGLQKQFATTPVDSEENLRGRENHIISLPGVLCCRALHGAHRDLFRQKQQPWQHVLLPE